MGSVIAFCGMIIGRTIQVLWISVTLIMAIAVPLFIMSELYKWIFN